MSSCSRRPSGQASIGIEGFVADDSAFTYLPVEVAEPGGWEHVWLMVEKA
jgi:hypothetical protein